MHTVVAIDDHRLFSAGIELIFKRYFASVEFLSFGSVGSAFDNVTIEPSAILLDFNLYGISGTYAVDLLLARWPAARIIVVTSEDRDSVVRQLAQRTEIAVVSKSETLTVLIDVIKSALAISDKQPAVSPELSARQMEILHHLREGHSNKTIARLTSLSEFTVRGHLQQIYKQIGATSRTSAVFLAQQAGLI